MESTNQKLRRMAMELRRKPISLSDMIPLLLEAADTIEQQAEELRYKQNILDNAAAISRTALLDRVSV